MPSPVRRSIRGAPPTTTITSKPSIPQLSTNSSSSTSSIRQERLTRGKETSHPRSLSSDDMDDGPPRRSARAHKDDLVKDTDPDDEPGDDEEVTRCICGFAEYPGPSLESEAFAGIPDALSEDAGGFFVCCDGCGVWQHGGCAGILDEGIVHGQFKYWCEQCKPKLHEMHTDSKGQSYSLYLPLHPKTQRKSSVSRDDDKSKKPVSRASVDPSTGKRRATTRSKEHDDEEEQLKRAIEESKREAEGGSNGSRRNGKRSRDDSEESKPAVKRQRTTSLSHTSTARQASDDEEESEDDELDTTGGRNKKARQDVVQSARQAAQQEKDKEREKARAEAAGRRQERAGRRRADEIDLPDESTPKPVTSSRSSPPIQSSPPGSPAATEKVSHRKGAGKKVKKLGNNQYTKYRGENAIASSPHSRKRFLQHHGAASGDEAVDQTESNGKASPTPAELGNGNARGRFGKGKKGAMATNHLIGVEVEKTFSNMKNAVDSMNAWVTRQRLEVKQPSSAGSSSEKSPGGLDEPLSVTSGGDGTLIFSPEMDIKKPFEELSLEEMALALQKGFDGWNRRFGQFAQPAIG